MASLRTQIYLTKEQRAELDDISRRTGKSLAQVIRDAIDVYVGDRSEKDVDRVLEETFGAAPSFSIPSRKELWGEGGSRPT